MSADEPTPSLCERVFDRLVEWAGGDGHAGADGLRPGGPFDGQRDELVLAEHLGSCMACFRSMTELRDVPRLAAMLRTDVVAPPAGDRFWSDLAARTTDAVTNAVGGTTAESAAVQTTVGVGVAGGGWRRGRRAPAALIATALAAAAAFALVPRLRPISSVGGPAVPAAGVHFFSSDDEPSDAADVGDLDRAALGRLLDRLRAGAPRALTASAEADPADGAEALLDDEGQVNDELAELDGPALLRVERSLGKTPL